VRREASQNVDVDEKKEKKEKKGGMAGEIPRLSRKLCYEGTKYKYRIIYSGIEENMFT